MTHVTHHPVSFRTAKCGAKFPSTKIFRSALLCAIVICVASPVLADGGRWVVSWDTGCRLWQPSPREGEQVRWRGRCENGKAQGDGVAEWFVNPALPDRCECHFVNGRAEGLGNYRWADGVYYSGEFKAGSIEGTGLIRYPDGELYEGEFKNGLPNGWGVQVLPDNTRIMGKFRDGAHVPTD